MKQWFVAQTQVCKELFAQNNLKDQGFNVYLPRYKTTRRHARKTETILSPLFPRYLFVQLDLEVDRWRTVNGTRGIAYLLMSNELPAVVPESIVDSLKAQEEDGVIAASIHTAFSKGENVRIAEGTFKGCMALFEKVDAKQRVQLLLDFLGREMKISLPMHAIEAI